MSNHQPGDRVSVERQLLAAYLADRNVPCPRCRYNLRGVTSGSCPECGEEIIITVGQADHSTTLWIAAMALYGIAVGFTGLVAFAAMMNTVFDGERDADDFVALVATITAFAAAAVGLAIVSRRRERIWGCSVLTQCLIILSVLLVPLAAFVVLAAGMAVIT